MTIVLKPGELVLANTADEADWLAARRTGIGASEISAVAGLSTRRGPMDVWSAKIDGTEFEPTDEMRWGTWIEQRIIDWWAQESGRTVGRGGLYRHPDHRWLLATPDALVLGDNTSKPPALDGSLSHRLPLVPVATVDAKNGGWHTRDEWDEDGAPIDYLAQITQQMMAVGVRTGYLVATLGGKPPFEREISLDEEFAALLITAGDELWQHVQDGTPPPMDGTRSARRWLSRRYPDADPSATVKLDDADVAAIVERAQIEEQIKDLQQIADRIEQQIKAKLQTAWAGTYNGRPYVTWKTATRAGYTVPSGTYRRFHVPIAALREMGHGERR